MFLAASTVPPSNGRRSPPAQTVASTLTFIPNLRTYVGARAYPATLFHLPRANTACPSLAAPLPAPARTHFPSNPPTNALSTPQRHPAYGTQFNLSHERDYRQMSAREQNLLPSGIPRGPGAPNRDCEAGVPLVSSGRASSPALSPVLSTDAFSFPAEDTLFISRTAWVSTLRKPTRLSLAIGTLDRGSVTASLEARHILGDDRKQLIAKT
ncbi:hypothetical protein K488DRAFT_88629 [Vararia minispora EC-137]|uniref:Uncharacterized protein n=1 Tax=Vararia minispora EC-137 TaxID=1314806 RepID=A0ACB8QCZ8_9AGAM|nr:hypothetical protein K488DRAFT_88629 [Vararia minispora EC-137]